MKLSDISGDMQARSPMPNMGQLSALHCSTSRAASAGELRIEQACSIDIVTGPADAQAGPDGADTSSDTAAPLVVVAVVAVVTAAGVAPVPMTSAKCFLPSVAIFFVQSMPSPG